MLMVYSGICAFIRCLFVCIYKVYVCYCSAKEFVRMFCRRMVVASDLDEE